MRYKRSSQQAVVLRTFRKIHRISGVVFFVFLTLMGITGILLGWKKHSGGLIQAETATGTTTDLKNWLPLDSLKNIACRIIQDSVFAERSPQLDRIDVRPDKGVIKFSFKGHYRGVQLDGATGAVLKIEHRNSDLIESIHDGSIVDRTLGTDPWFKLIYNTALGLSLLLFSVTGFWLWYGPKRMRK